MKSKYIINIDSEGLRSPELSGDEVKQKKHDNEMATLIIAISD